MSSRWEWGCFELINWSGDCTISDLGCCRCGVNLTEPESQSTEASLASRLLWKLVSALTSSRGKPCFQAPRKLVSALISFEDEQAWFRAEWTRPADLQTFRPFLGPSFRNAVLLSLTSSQLRGVSVTLSRSVFVKSWSFKETFLDP